MMRVERGAKRSTAPDLFLSHSSKDKAFVRRLALDLARCGVDCWLDEWELEPGRSLFEVLADGMAKARFIAIVITGNYLSSPWTKAEFGQALARQRATEDVLLLPLLAEDVTPPSFLEDKIYIDFRADYYVALVRLVARIHGVPEARVSHALQDAKLFNINYVYAALRSMGFQPFVVADERDFDDLVKLGARRDGDTLWFSPNEVCPLLPMSSRLRDLLEPLKGDSEK